VVYTDGKSTELGGRGESRNNLGKTPSKAEKRKKTWAV